MVHAVVERSARFLGIRSVLQRSCSPDYRLSQILRSIYQRKTLSYLYMYEIPSHLRSTLHDHFGGSLLSLKPCATSKSDRACKVLFENKDGTKVEAVLLTFPTHKSLCISSQVGCAFACSFCATGKIGLKRNLSLDEITDQVLYFQQLGHKIDSISFMGMGEPLSNPNVFRAMHVLNDSELFGTSARRLNISTVGILPGLKKLNREHPTVNLAFSMHSPYHEQRNKLVPVNLMYPFQEVFNMCDERIRLTGKRIWVSYVLMKGENDSKDHAEELVKVIKQRPEDIRYLYHVNLIPYNVAKSVDLFERAEENSLDVFKSVLKKNKISYSLRNHFGQAIDAACGQLFAAYEPAERPLPLAKPRRQQNTGRANKAQ